MEKKTKQISIKLTEDVYRRVKSLAKNGYRSLSQQVDKIILEHPDFKDIREEMLNKK